MKKRVRIIFLLFLLVVLFVAGLYYVFFLRLVRVPTGAMSNTILPGDRLVVNRLFSEVNRGDIIIFSYPADPSIRYVSRVIGLPGERIQIRGRLVYINDQELPEKRVLVEHVSPEFNDALREISSDGEGRYRVFYFNDEAGESTFAAPVGTAEPFLIPEGNYFVMGDNRDNSFDSRFRGTVPRRLVTGKPLLIYWSVKRDENGATETRWGRMFSRPR